MIGVIDSPAKAARCAAFEAAQKAAHEAVRKAGLVRSHCESCGLMEGVRLHHDSYDRPLDVRGLCPRCHDSRHRALGWGYPEGHDGWQVDGDHWTPPPGCPPLEDALDFAMFDAAPAEPSSDARSSWLARRELGFGASEIAPLLVALGRVTPAEVAALPQYMRELASRIFRRMAFPRTRQKMAGSAASGGKQNERPCLMAWARTGCRVHASLVSVHHESEAPRCWFPLVDRHEIHSTATPDGWALSVLDENVGIEVKTTVEPLGAVVPWWFRKQVQQQNGIAGYDWSALVIGEGWAHWQSHRRQPPRAVRIERDELEIERIRAACRDGWARVEEMRADRKGKAA